MKRTLISLFLCLALLVGLLPAGTAAIAAGRDLAATGDYDYTDPDNPYMATDLNGLKEVFEKERPTGTTVYIKLAKDIFTSVHTGTLNLLTTNGADVVLDLAGYTMGITSNYSILMIEGVNGTVTIEDSKRYDSAKKQWVDGRLEFECQTHLLGYSQTYVLAGNIIVKGGVIKNNNHSAKRQDCGYYGRNLEMYGGTLDADYPIYLCSLGDLKKCAVHDGTLRVRRDVAISSPFADFIVPNRHPVIERCFIENASDNEKVSAVNLTLMRDFTEKYTADDALKLWYTIVSPETYAFINGVRQPQGSHGVLYNGDGALVGPLFRESYVLTPLDTVSTLRFTVDEPQAGNAILYAASTPSRAPYQVEDYDDDSNGWRNGVQWGYYDYNDSVLAHVYNSEGTVYFRPGVRYGIWIRVSLKDPYLARFADPEELSATVNGNAAKVTENLDGTLTVSCDFNVSNVLSYVQVMVPEPVVGEAIPYAASVPTYAQEQYEVPALSSGTYRNGVLWSKNGAPLNPASAGDFEYGNKYTAYILVKPTPDYVFPEPDELTAVINNRVAERVVNYGEYGYAFVYTFDLTDLVGSVELTIPEPDAGNPLEWTASAPEGADYTVADVTSGMMANGVMWYQGTTAITPGRAVRFEVFETYKVVIRIKALNGRHFSGEDMPALVNGHTAAVSGAYSDADYLIAYTFTAKDLIDSLDLTIPAPAIGGAVTYQSALDEESGFERADEVFDSDDEYWKNGMRWTENGEPLPAASSYTFTAGREYTVHIAVNPTNEPQFTYADTEDLTSTVNGHQATIERSVYCYIVSYTFTLDKTIVDMLDVTVPEPQAGDVIGYEAFVPEGAGYMIQPYSDGSAWENGVSWSDEYGAYNPQTTNTFEAGGTYTVEVAVVLTDTNRYEFAPMMSMIACINDDWADFDRISGMKYILSYTFTIPAGTTGLLGDVDGDGKVDIFDASSIQKSLAGTAGYVKYADLDPADTAFRIADVNKDGKVDIFDVSLIQKWIAGDAAAKTYGIGEPI